MKVTVAGTGYVGLVVGACLAYLGHTVICYDTDNSKVDGLQKGVLPIYEPGLHELIEKSGTRLSFTTSPESMKTSDIIVIAVGTPPRDDGSTNLDYVDSVAKIIGEYAPMRPFLVLIKSTVPVGTANRVRAIVSEGTFTYFDVVSNPEFLREGAAINDFLFPARIVVGCREDSRQRIKELYAHFLPKTPLYFMDNKSAELAKYTANALLAVKISYINEIAGLCERLGADVDRVSRAVGADPRIGHDGLRPGVGYGGSCFPKDVDSLLTTADDAGTPLSIVEAAKRVNTSQKQLLLVKLDERYGQENLRGMRFAVWGLSFKPGTDDIREAPSQVLLKTLALLGAEIAAYDPQAMSAVQEVLGDRIRYAADPLNALDGADALILLTEWPEFNVDDWGAVADRMPGRVVFDGRNLWDPVKVRAAGFEYHGIGRP